MAEASNKQSKARMSVLADGTTVDQEYYQSKHYILSQLEQRKGDKTSDADPSAKKSGKQNADAVTKGMLKSGAISEDDGWLLASMELCIRNPFCIANHPAQDQVKFYQKVFLISSIFMFMVALATMLWTWWWGIIIKGGTKPIMPCRGNGDTFGVVRLCNDTSGDFNTQLGDDGCDEGAPLSICVEDSCINSVDDDLRNCWYIAAFVMVVFSAYMMLLFRRDQAGKGLLSCACFIEGILGGAATLHYDSSIFLEFFSYLTAASVLGMVIFTKMSQKKMEEWEKLPNQVGSTKITVPEVEILVQGQVKKSYFIGGAVTSVVSLIWHFGGPNLTGGSTIAYFLAIFALWLAIGWIVREMSWTQHKYDADQFVNMCISFHVDLFCIFILLMIFVFFVLNDSCHQGPISCLPHCAQMCAVQGDRCARFACGVPGRNMSSGAAADGTVPAGEGEQSSKRQSKSQHVEKEVETHEAWKRRKMINAGCAFGILGLAGMSFFVPQLSFAVALAICVGLPFFRAAQNKEEDHSNV